MGLYKKARGRHLAVQKMGLCKKPPAFQGLCKKSPAFRLAAYAAKFYFEWTLFYLILLRKMR